MFHRKPTTPRLDKVIIVVPGQAPYVGGIPTRSNAEARLRAIEKLVGQATEETQFPGDKKYRVIYHAHGRAYGERENVWGLYGVFVVVKGKGALKDDDVNELMKVIGE